MIVKQVCSHYNHIFPVNRAFEILFCQLVIRKNKLQDWDLAFCYIYMISYAWNNQLITIEKELYIWWKDVKEKMKWLFT